MDKKNGFGKTPEERRANARKGGLSVSQNREHMSKIGKLGGFASGKVRKKKPDGATEI